MSCVPNIPLSNYVRVVPDEEKFQFSPSQYLYHKNVKKVTIITIY